MTPAPEPFFRLKPAPGGVWPTLPDPRYGQLWTAYLSLTQTQWLPPDEIARRQIDQARELLRHAAAHVPHYRRTFAAAGVDPEQIRTPDDFRRVPLLPRTAIGDLGADLHAATLPEGIQAAGEGSTSGTSGVPVTVLQTTREQLWWLAFYLRDLEWARIDPRLPLASIRPIKPKSPEHEQALLTGTKLPHWHPALAPLIEMGPAYAMELRQDPQKHYDWLRRVDPAYLLGYPSHLDLVAELAGKHGRPAGLKAIQVIAERLAPEVKARIEAAFGVPVVDLYSCTEAGYLASPCPAGHGLHVHAENVLLEVLDDAGNPCPPGVPGRVVITALHNFRMPFIRYDILDGAVPGGPCPCGRGLPLLRQIDGKLRPWFRLPGGNRKSTSPLSMAFQKLPGLLQYQVTQRSTGRLSVRLVPGRDWTADSLALAKKEVDEYLETPGWADIEVVPEIPRSAGGKVRDFVSEAPDPVPPAVHVAPRRGKTVLLGWELGGGFGHVRPLLAVAQALADDGHRPVFALKDVLSPWAAFRDAPWPVLLAPSWVKPPEPGKPTSPASFGDVLAVHGYASADVLASLVACWDGILGATRPDLVLCDFSPTLVLTATGRVPVVDVGNGYCQPPYHLPSFPKSFEDREPAYPEADTLRVVRAVMGDRLRPGTDTLPAAFAGAERCVTVFPELDPYRGLRTESCLGPLDPMPPPLPPPATPRFFAYLAAEVASTEPALRLLAKGGFAGEAYVRGSEPDLRDRLRADGLTVHDRPVPLADAFARCGVLVHHGGLSAGEAALCAGRPQLLLPIHGEHILNATALHKLGTAHFLAGEYPASDVLEAVRQLTFEPKFHRRAADLAAHFARMPLGTALQTVRDRCRTLLG